MSTFQKLIDEIKYLEQFLDFGNTSGSAHQHNLIDLVLVQFGVLQGLLHGVQGAAEQIGAQFLETGPGDVGVKVDSVEKRVDFNATKNVKT